MSGTRRVGVGLVAVAVAVTAALAGPARAEPSLTDVYDALGVDKVPADYVVFVDVSASMQQNGRYAGVKASLRSFFAALAPDDQVALGTFADGARVVREGAAGRAPDNLIAALPATATGSSTDIGAAIEAAVRHLQRPGAPPIATVVLLTDGLHEPPRGSAYPYTQGYAWDRLAQDVTALRKTSLTAFAVPLGGATGAGLLAKAFPTAQVIDPTSIDQLTARLEQPKAAARAAKARTVLADDLTRGIRVEWPRQVRDLGAGRTTVTVRLTATTTHLPLTVSDLRVGGPVHASVRGGPVTLQPGRSATVAVVVDWDPGPRRFAPWSTVSRRAGLELTGTVGSPWAAILTGELGLTFNPRLTGGGTEVGLSAQRGSLAVWLGCLVALLVLAVTLRHLRGRRLAPTLSGVLHARGPGGDEHQLPLSGRSVALSTATIGLPGFGRVHATRASVGSAAVHLTITYSRTGAPDASAVGTCAPGEPVEVSGVEFTWRASVPKPRRGAPATTSQDVR